MKFCTRRFRGNVLDVAASTIAIQIDALPAAEADVVCFRLEADLVALRSLWRQTTGVRGGDGLADVAGQRAGIGQIRPVPYLFRGEDHQLSQNRSAPTSHLGR